MALYFECRINKKRTPQTVFWGILPTEMKQLTAYYMHRIGRNGRNL